MCPTTPEAADLARFGLADLDPDDLIRSSSFCAMVHTSHQLGQEIAPELSRLQLTDTMYHVLGQVFAHPGAIPAELARRCALSPQHLAGVLDSAEERGLVNRLGERGRGRTTQVVLTDAGIELLLAGWPIVHGAGTDRLTDQQHRSLQVLLEQLRGSTARDDDVVVLVDEEGNDAGTAPRLEVHTADTPLHRAFSTHLRRADGKVLLTRRAVHKKTWPGVWTNSACGHLLPGETPIEAALRRVAQEIGATPTNLRVVLPDFRYRAVDASGIVEHELCPVMVGDIDPDELNLNPDEVAEHDWVEWSDFQEVVRTAPFLLSPWAVLQVSRLGDQPW